MTLGTQYRRLDQDAQPQARKRPMADRTKIEWADATWNPIRGCARVSEGCRNCYAERLAARFSGPGEAYEGLAILKQIQLPYGGKRSEARWTGAVRFFPSKLSVPLAWTKPRRIFVNSTSDLFYEKLETRHIDEIFAVMTLADHHKFQVLTKRVARMREYTQSVNARRPVDTLVARVAALATSIAAARGENTSSPYFDTWLESWPLKHIWLGASAENQETYDARRRDLENTDAAVIWWSLEPLLGPIRLNLSQGARLPDWIVVGGESGPEARPTHPDWVRRIRDDCLKRNIPFFFKQWGEWVAVDQNRELFTRGPLFRHTYVEEHSHAHTPGCPRASLMVFRAGKSAAGRMLDGVEWSVYPQ